MPVILIKFWQCSLFRVNGFLRHLLLQVLNVIFKSKGGEGVKKIAKLHGENQAYNCISDKISDGILYQKVNNWVCFA